MKNNTLFTVLATLGAVALTGVVYKLAEWNVKKSLEKKEAGSVDEITDADIIKDEAERKSKNKLNDRQKNILNILGFPEEFEELTGHQKDVIMTIEGMLSYAESKYGRALVFDSFSEDGSSIKVRAYAAETGDSDNTFEIIKMNNSEKSVFMDGYHVTTVYMDDYYMASSEYICSSLLKQHIEQELKGIDFMLLVDLKEYNGTFIPKTIEDFNGISHVNTKILIISEKMTKKEFTEFNNKYSEWLNNVKLSGSHSVALMKDKQNMSELDYNNLTDNQYVTLKNTIDVD